MRRSGLISHGDSYSVQTKRAGSRSPAPDRISRKSDENKLAGVVGRHFAATPLFFAAPQFLLPLLSLSENGHHRIAIGHSEKTHRFVPRWYKHSDDDAGQLGKVRVRRPQFRYLIGDGSDEGERELYLFALNVGVLPFLHHHAALRLRPRGARPSRLFITHTISRKYAPNVFCCDRFSPCVPTYCSLREFLIATRSSPTRGGLSRRVSNTFSAFSGLMRSQSSEEMPFSAWSISALSGECDIVLPPLSQFCFFFTLNA